MRISDRELLSEVSGIHGIRDTADMIGGAKKSSIANWINGKYKANLSVKQRRVLFGKLSTIKKARKTMKHFKGQYKPKKITKGNVQKLAKDWHSATHTTYIRRTDGKAIYKTVKKFTTEDKRLSKVSFSGDRRYIYGVMEIYGSKGTSRYITSRKFSLHEMTEKQAIQYIHDDIADILYRKALKYDDEDRDFDKFVSFELKYTYDIRETSLIHQEEEKEMREMAMRAREDRRNWNEFRKSDLYDKHEYDSQISVDENYHEWRRSRYEYEY